MPLSGIPAETVAAERWRRGEVQISPGVWMPVLGLGTFKIRGADATRPIPEEGLMYLLYFSSQKIIASKCQ